MKTQQSSLLICVDKCWSSIQMMRELFRVDNCVFVSSRWALIAHNSFSAVLDYWNFKTGSSQTLCLRTGTNFLSLFAFKPFSHLISTCRNTQKLVLTQPWSGSNAQCTINLHPCRCIDQLDKLEIKSCSCQDCCCCCCCSVGSRWVRLLCLNNTVKLLADFPTNTHTPFSHWGRLGK